MLRFPYRRTWPEPGAGVVPGFLGRFFRRLTGGAVVATHAPVRESEPRPVVSVRIKGPTGSRRLKSALLDTGSQDTLFPFELARPLGIVLGGERRAISWRGKRYWVDFQVAELELTQYDVTWRWRARVGFTSAPLSYALLGQRGCLDILDAKFFGADQVVEFETNRAFPGTIVTRS
jgi:hypothetical protein